MANPRKFSEKIALLNQKEAEGNAEFERIMREVSEVSSKVSQTAATSANTNTNLIATTSAFISRSLPNVNAPINNANNMNDIDNKDNEPSPTTLAGLLTTGYSNDNKNASADKSTARESRGRSVGGGPMRARQRNIDTSPYSNTAYLSPPQESSWRRTSSDSAIHQSLAQAQDNIHNNVQSLMLSPRTHKRLSNSQSNSMKNLHQQHPNQSTINQQHSHSQQNMQAALLTQQNLIHQQNNMAQHLNMNHLQQDMKSRSVSRLPGIPVYQQQNNELLQIPAGNSTGSLPDLTQVHFQQSPISNSIDPQDQLNTVTNSFSANPSFSMASTNQLPSMTQQQMFTPMGNNLDQFSPKHYANNGTVNKGSSSQGLIIQQGTNNSHNNFAQHPQQSSPIPIDSNQQRQQSPSHHQSYPNQITVDKMMSYRSTNAASPAGNLSMSQGNLSKGSYRSSPNNRPSPGSSPIGLSANFDSNSSAPCSPSPQMSGNNGIFDAYPVDANYLNPATSIQQHFEQFSLVDTQQDYITSNDQNYSQNIDSYNGILNDSPNRQHTNRNNVSRPHSRNACNSSQQHSPSTNNHHNHDGSSPHSPLGSDTMLSGNNYESLRNMLGSSSPLDGVLLNGINNGGINDIMLGAGIGSDSTSKLISSSQTSLMTSPSHHLTQNTTAIPEIILSEHIDYSTGSIDFSHDLLQDNFLELGMNSTELQMTFDNASIIDPSIEENFRRDLY